MSIIFTSHCGGIGSWTCQCTGATEVCSAFLRQVCSFLIYPFQSSDQHGVCQCGNALQQHELATCHCAIINQLFEMVRHFPLRPATTDSLRMTTHLCQIQITSVSNVSRHMDNMTQHQDSPHPRFMYSHLPGCYTFCSPIFSGLTWGCDTCAICPGTIYLAAMHCVPLPPSSCLPLLAHPFHAISHPSFPLQPSLPHTSGQSAVGTPAVPFYPPGPSTTDHHLGVASMAEAAMAFSYSVYTAPQLFTTGTQALGER